jgi:hypothetical protein
VFWGESVFFQYEYVLENPEAYVIAYMRDKYIGCGSSFGSYEGCYVYWRVGSGTALGVG